MTIGQLGNCTGKSAGTWLRLTLAKRPRFANGHPTRVTLSFRACAIGRRPRFAMRPRSR
ncbi:MAG: hypothetical protein F6K26_30260 [Moorea sp. SIO2I5]|nr:hypothetical protein [Moorena sp. SIO2I5]